MELAIDRNAISKALYAGKMTPASQLLAPPVFGYDASIKPAGQDVAKAKQLVQESGYDGSEIVFEYAKDGPIAKSNELAQAIQGYLGDVGIKVKLVSSAFDTFVGSWFGKKLNGMYMFAFQPATMDGQLNFTYTLKSDGAPVYMKDTVIDELFTKQAGQADVAERKKLLSQISAQDISMSWFVHVLNDVNSYVAKASKVVVPSRPDGYLFVYDMYAA